MPDAHSLFSASGAKGWMTCHGKPAMERGRGTTSIYAAEGTAAHTVAQWVLERRLGREHGVRAEAYLGRVIECDGFKFTVDKKMAEHVNTYADTFMTMSHSRRTLRFVEQRLCYASHLGLADDQAFGTGDGNAAIPDAPEIEVDGIVFPAGAELQVHDLKYGQGVRVDAQQNPQLRLYGLGALYEFGLLMDFTRVRMVIHQPRLDHVSEEVISVEELLAWAEEPRAAVPLVLKAETIRDQNPDSYADRLFTQGLLKPSDEACRFCDAKLLRNGKPCPAIAAAAAQFATGGARSSPSDFTALRPQDVDTPADAKAYGDNWLAQAADLLDVIDTLRKAVRAEIDNRVLARGLHVPGFKVVQGSMGDRKWTDEGAAEKALLALGCGEATYARKVISPTVAEKQLKKTSPAFQSLGPLITRAPGAPSVVRDTDPRAEYDGHKAKASDFQPVAAPSGGHPFR